MARTTPVFAPGLDNLAQMGAIDATLDPRVSLAAQVLPILAQPPGADGRGARGADRGGRLKAAAIAARVQRLASV
jgi:malonate decarboxylase gamma subunit